MPGMPEQSTGSGAQTKEPSGNAPAQMPQVPTGQSQMEFLEGMKRPEGMGNRFPGQDGRDHGNFPVSDPMYADTVESDNLWLLVSISAAILLAGMLFVFKFRR